MILILRSPLSEQGENGPWEPCGACKTEVSKLKEEMKRMKDVLFSLGKLIVFVAMWGVVHK